MLTSYAVDCATSAIASTALAAFATTTTTLTETRPNKRYYDTHVGAELVSDFCAERYRCMKIAWNSLTCSAGDVLNVLPSVAAVEPSSSEPPADAVVSE